MSLTEFRYWAKTPYPRAFQPGSLPYGVSYSWNLSGSEAEEGASRATRGNGCITGFHYARCVDPILA